MAEITSSHIYVDHAEVFDETGLIKTDIIPASVTGTKITVSSTPPSNPQTGDLWIQIE